MVQKMCTTHMHVCSGASRVANEETVRPYTNWCQNCWKCEARVLSPFHEFCYIVTPFKILNNPPRNHCCQWKDISVRLTALTGPSLELSPRIILLELSLYICGTMYNYLNVDHWTRGMLYFSSLCRQPVLDTNGNVKEFTFDSTRGTLTLTGRAGFDVAVVSLPIIAAN